MTKQEFANKTAVIRHMIDTAIYNGKKPENTMVIYDLAARLHRLETTLNRLACDQCNYPEYDSAKQERIEKLAEKLIAENIGCKCYTQRDPRGLCIRMYLVDDEGRPWFNSWDGETTGLNW